jgi:hypothetical protein
MDVFLYEGSVVFIGPMLIIAMPPAPFLVDVVDVRAAINYRSRLAFSDSDLNIDLGTSSCGWQPRGRRRMPNDPRGHRRNRRMASDQKSGISDSGEARHLVPKSAANFISYISGWIRHPRCTHSYFLCYQCLVGTGVSFKGTFAVFPDARASLCVPNRCFWRYRPNVACVL